MKDSLKAGGGPYVTVPTASSVKLAVAGGSWPTWGNPLDVLRLVRRLNVPVSELRFRVQRVSTWRDVDW